MACQKVQTLVATSDELSHAPRTSHRPRSLVPITVLAWRLHSMHLQSQPLTTSGQGRPLFQHSREITRRKLECGFVLRDDPSRRTLVLLVNRLWCTPLTWCSAGRHTHLTTNTPRCRSAQLPRPERCRRSFALDQCSSSCVLSHTWATVSKRQSFLTILDHLSVSAPHMHCWRFTSNGCNHNLQHLRLKTSTACCQYLQGQASCTEARPHEAGAISSKQVE